MVPSQSVRREGAAHSFDPGRRPCDVLREQGPLCRGRRGARGAVRPRPSGEAEFVREGDDVTIVAIGRMVSMAEQAAESLADEGIECEIVDPRTTSPLDEETICESGREHGPAGGRGRVEPAAAAWRPTWWRSSWPGLLRRPEGGAEDGDAAAHAAAVQPDARGPVRALTQSASWRRFREVAGAGARA